MALPLLRPLRLLRVILLLAVLNRHAGGSLRGRVLVSVVGATCLLSFVAALTVLDYERQSPEAKGPAALAGDIEAGHACVRIILARAKVLGLVEIRKDNRASCRQPQTVILRQDDCRAHACPDHT